MADIIAAARDAAVAVFALRSQSGEPMAVPVTPYVDDDRVAVTSTLAYIRKAELVRRDGRVAMLAGGVHSTGDAEVFADTEGDVFAARYLEQELAKYPPARELVRIPDYRRALSWYFGRAIIVITPRDVVRREGVDAGTLVTIDAGGYPSITPFMHSASAGESAPGGIMPGVRPLDPATSTWGSGTAAGLMLFHRESDDMSMLRHMTLRGRLDGTDFYVESRNGTLADDDGAAPVDYAARERRARDVMRDWPLMTPSAT